MEKIQQSSSRLDSSIAKEVEIQQKEEQKEPIIQALSKKAQSCKEQNVPECESSPEMKEKHLPDHNSMENIKVPALVKNDDEQQQQMHQGNDSDHSSSSGSDEDEGGEDLEEDEVTQSTTSVVVEVSPKGRFKRFGEELGRGAYKIVYRGVDNETGREIAWNVINLNRLPKQDRQRIKSEIDLIKRLKHKNIIHFIAAWFNKDREQVVFVTEMITGGSLRKYVKKIKNPRLKVIKLWFQEILQGLIYLHQQKPHPIIHRDLKCDNIFINSHSGEIRIGDLGLATPMTTSYTTSVLGTPEFMAPELYEECYGTSVDIYAFGMCALELITLERPYKECQNPAQIYSKVIQGIRPKALNRIEDEEVVEFILFCLQRADKRPTAKQLLESKFMTDLESEKNNHEVKVQPKEQKDKLKKRNSYLYNKRAGSTILEEVEESDEESKQQSSEVTVQGRSSGGQAEETKQLQQIEEQNDTKSSFSKKKMENEKVFQQDQQNLENNVGHLQVPSLDLAAQYSNDSSMAQSTSQPQYQEWKDTYNVSITEPQMQSCKDQMDEQKASQGFEEKKLIQQSTEEVNHHDSPDYQEKLLAKTEEYRQKLLEKKKRKTGSIIRKANESFIFLNQMNQEKQKKLLERTQLCGYKHDGELIAFNRESASNASDNDAQIPEKMLDELYKQENDETDRLSKGKSVKQQYSPEIKTQKDIQLSPQPLHPPQQVSTIVKSPKQQLQRVQTQEEDNEWKQTPQVDYAKESSANQQVITPFVSTNGNPSTYESTEKKKSESNSNFIDVKKQYKEDKITTILQSKTQQKEQQFKSAAVQQNQANVQTKKSDQIKMAPEEMRKQNLKDVNSTGNINDQGMKNSLQREQSLDKRKNNLYQQNSSDKLLVNPPVINTKGQANGKSQFQLQTKINNLEFDQQSSSSNGAQISDEDRDVDDIQIQEEPQLNLKAMSTTPHSKFSLNPKSTNSDMRKANTLPNKTGGNLQNQQFSTLAQQQQTYLNQQPSLTGQKSQATPKMESEKSSSQPTKQSQVQQQSKLSNQQLNVPTTTKEETKSVGSQSKAQKDESKQNAQNAQQLQQRQALVASKSPITHTSLVLDQHIISEEKNQINMTFKFKSKDGGTSQDVTFDFDMRNDTPQGVAKEMVRDLSLPQNQVDIIVKQIQGVLEKAKISFQDKDTHKGSRHPSQLTEQQKQQQSQPQESQQVNRVNVSPNISSDNAIGFFNKLFESVDSHFQQISSKNISHQEIIEAMDIPEEEKRIKQEFLTQIFNSKMSYKKKLMEYREANKQQQQMPVKKKPTGQLQQLNQDQQQQQQQFKQPATVPPLEKYQQQQQALNYQQNNEASQQYHRRQQAVYRDEQMPGQFISHEESKQGSIVTPQSYSKVTIYYPSSIKKQFKTAPHYFQCHQRLYSLLKRHQEAPEIPDEQVQMLQHVLNLIFSASIVIMKNSPNPSQDSKHIIQNYIPLPVDGYFGERTEQHVMKFQKHIQVQQDGIVSEPLWISLLNYVENIINEDAKEMKKQCFSIIQPKQELKQPLPIYQSYTQAPSTQQQSRVQRDKSPMISQQTNTPNNNYVSKSQIQQVTVQEKQQNMGSPTRAPLKKHRPIKQEQPIHIDQELYGSDSDGGARDKNYDNE